TQTITLRGIQFVQRGKKLAMALDGLRADAAPPPRYRWNKTVLRMCFVQTLQMVKVNRLPEATWIL
ncbi:MAG TPA: hypothetical protein VK615_01040, partial [Candidatus Binatia bacterium]|nr:hypothetical protein [Candidatus Binatia bacterium]